MDFPHRSYSSSGTFWLGQNGREKRTVKKNSEQNEQGSRGIIFSELVFSTAEWHRRDAAEESVVVSGGTEKGVVHLSSGEAKVRYTRCRDEPSFPLVYLCLLSPG